MSGYSHPEVLCDTDWVANNLKNANIRILEVDYDPENAYRQGHVPGAHLIWWRKDINDPVRRDIISKQLNDGASIFAKNAEAAKKAASTATGATIKTVR